MKTSTNALIGAGIAGLVLGGLIWDVNRGKNRLSQEPQRINYSSNFERFQSTDWCFNDYNKDGLVDTIERVSPRQTIFVATDFTNQTEIYSGFGKPSTMSSEMRKAASDYMKSVADFIFSVDRFNYEQNQGEEQ